MKDIFKRLITDFQEVPPRQVLPREYTIPLESRKIVSLIGVRRSGKTCLLYGLINQLRQQIDPRNIIYINFEDDRLYPLEMKTLDNLTEAYYELYPEKRDEKVYLFLDEVQTVDGWERYVRRIYDTLNLQIFVTGSSAKLLGSEIATSLRGRTLRFEIFPFSFREYLAYNKIEINLHSSKSISHIQHALMRYQHQGGFAETFGEPSDIQRKILRDYLDLIIYRDLIDRYNLKNRSLLKHLIKYSLTNIGTLVSFNKLYNEYKSLGYKVSKDTLYNYFTYLEDAYALFTVPIFRNSVKEEMRNPRKLYAVDTGFKSLFETSRSPDFSKLYENIGFLQLRRKTDQINYVKENKEVDFYCRATTPSLINVSYDISAHSTRKREIQALEEGMASLNLKESLLLTRDTHETIDTNNGTIICLPLYEWLLSDF